MADTELFIQIEAEASKANAELGKVNEALQSIQTSISGISDILNGLSSKGRGVSSSMKILADAVNSINPTAIKEISRSMDSMASSADKSEKKVKNVTSSVNDLNQSLSSTNGASAFEKMLPAIQDASDKMAIFNQWVDACFKRDIGIDTFSQQMRQIPQIMQEITASNGVNVLASQFQESVPLIEQATNGIIDFDRYVKDCFNSDLGFNNIAREFIDIEQKVGTALVPFRNFTEELGRTETEITDFVMIIQQGFGGVPAVIQQSLDGMSSGIKHTFDGVTEEVSGLPAVIERNYVDMFERLERVFDSSKFNFEASWRDLGSEKINNAPFEMPSSVIPTWKEALEQVQAFENEYSKLSGIMGEADAEMQTAVNIVNTLNRAFSMTKSGQMSWDTSRMKEASSILSEMQDKIDRVNASFQNQNMLGGNVAPEMQTWKNVFDDIEAISNSFSGLSTKIGEANAEMSNLIEVRNRLRQAFSDTESGKLLWDNESMQKATTMLSEVEDKISRVKSNMATPNRLTVDVTQPLSELGELYQRANELNQLLSDMRSNKINFDTSDVQKAIAELDSVNARIKTLEGRGSNAPSNNPEQSTTDIMAQLVALQHELSKASQAFSRFGDIAKDAFLKCLTPLKLFKYEFEEIKGLVTFVSRIGSAFAMISKPITKVFNSLQKQALSVFSKIQKAWGKVMRTFTFMLIRKAITKVLSDINDASVSLAKFSKSIGTPFNDTMSLITSDLRYIAASVMALFSTILNAALPTFNSIVDSIVAVINKVNMFLAILTNAKSYTIAKKKIVDYTEATKDASKAVKQLTMGIDELNILNDKSSSNDTSAEDMFDWQEIPTPTIDIPEWLKWLKELLKKLWDAIMEMLKALWDAIKKAWVNVRDFFIAAFKHLIESIVGLILDIIRDLTRVFKTKEFQEFLERIFRIIAKIAELIATIVDRIRIAWNYNDLGFRILMDILAILNTIAKHIENMLDMSIEWAKTLDFIPLFEAIEKALRQVNYAIDQIGYTVERVWGIVLGILKLAIEDYIPRLIGVLGNVAEGIGNLFGQLNNAWDATDFTNKFVAAFDGIMQAIIPHIEAIGVYFKNWASEVDFEPLLKSFLKLAKSLKPVAEFIGGVFEDVVTKYILPMVQHIIEKVLPMIADGISHFANTVDWGQLRKGLAKVIEGFEHMQGSIGEGVAMAIDRIGQALAKFINSDNFQKFLDNLANFLKSISPELVSNVLTAIGLAILRIASALVKFVNSELFQKFLRSLINFLTYKDANRLATYLLNIAKAIALFKFAAFVSKGLSGFMGFLAVIAKIKEIKALKDIATSVQNIGTAAESAGGTLSGFGTALKTIGSTIGGVIKTIGGIGAIIGGSILAIKEFIDMWVNGWDIIKTILEALGIALAAVGAVILGAPAAVAAVVAGIVFAVSQLVILLHDHWEEISKWFSEAWSNFSTWAVETWRNIVKGISEVWNGFVDMISGVWQNVKTWFASAWSDFSTWAVETWNTIVTNIANAWNTFLEKIQGVWATVSGWFETTWGTFKSWVSEIWLSIVQTIMDAWNGITEFLSGIWQTIYDTAVNAFNGVADFIKGVWDSVKQFTSEIWNNIWDFLSGLWENIKNTATSLFGEIKDFVSSVWDSIEGTWNGIWNDIFNTLASWWNTIREDALNGWNNAVSFVMALWDGIKEKWDGIWGGIKTTLLEIWDSIRQEAQNGWDKAVQVVTNLWNGIHEAWDKMWGGVLNMLSDWWNKVKTTATSVWGDITDKLAGIWDGVEEAWHDIWNGIGKFIGGVINGIMGALEGLANGVIEVINCVIRGINSLSIDIPETPFSDGFTLGFSIPELSKHSFPRINIPAYASGGFPEDGLFYANHNELIGSFNGRTAVANNDMITDGIAQAVSSQLVPILTDIAQSSRRTADKDTVLRVDSRDIAKANNVGQSKLGKSLVSFT